MDKQLETILQKQQIHARIKHTRPAGLSHVCRDAQDASPFAEHIVLEIRKAARRNRQPGYYEISRTVRRFLHHPLSAFTVYFPSEADAPEDTNPDPASGETEPDSIDAACLNPPALQAELAIEAGKFKKAKRILDKAMAEEPNFWLNIPYAALYDAMGESDKAVSLLTDTIYGHFGIQNMLDPLASGNLLYEALKAIPKKSLTTTAERLRRCLSDCDRYFGKYETLSRLIEQKLFPQALALCEELKAEGTCDNYLYHEFYECYVGLKAFDECDAYLRGLLGKKTDILDHRYPDDGAIDFLLGKLEEQKKTAP